MKAIAERIELALQNNNKLYFRCKNSEGQVIKIRVADHRMNDKNNYDRGEFCISFISSNERKNNAWMSNYEWLINDDMMTDNYETIEDILKDFELTEMIY